MGSACATTALVLVVEDDLLIRMEALSSVEDAGYRAIAAGSADEALLALNKFGGIIAIFTDVEMPGLMDGLALAHETRRRWPAIKILIVSGKAKLTSEDVPDQARFLKKPYTPAQIAITLNELMA